MKNLLAGALRHAANLIDPHRVTTRVIESRDRGEAGMCLLDPEVIGFALLLVRDEGNGCASVDLRMDCDEQTWPGLEITLGRLVEEGRRAFA